MDKKTASHGDSPADTARNGVREQGWQEWGQRNTAGVSIASSLAFDGISHDFGKGLVLDGVSLEVKPGNILCLLGPSGSGKTTLLRIAAGIEQPLAGSVLIDGRIVSGDGVHEPPEKRGVGLVFQDFALFPHLSNLENVAFGLRGMETKVANGQADHMLSRVGMERFGGMYPHQLSGGEQQRVALARALAPRPGVLLLDEPFSGLDARLRDNVREGTIRLLRETRATAVIVTHNPEEALRVGDHIALLRGGRVVQAGTAEELYLRPLNLFAARFFSEMNIFTTRAESGHASTPWCTVPATGFGDGAKVDVCVRHGDVVLTAWRKGAAGIAGRIRARRFAGEVELVEVWIEGTDEPLSARIRAGDLGDGISDVTIDVRPEDVFVFASA